MHKKYTRFYGILLFIPLSIDNSQFESMWMTFNHLKTNSTKFAYSRLNIRKVIEFFDFQSLMQHPLCSSDYVLKEYHQTKSGLEQIYDYITERFILCPWSTWYEKIGKSTK